MRKGLLVLTLALAVTTLASSQTLQETLLEISTDLRALSDEFDEGFTTLETQLQSFRSESTQILAEHSTRLDDSESDLESFEGSLTALRSSHTEYRIYVQKALAGQATRIRQLERELWIYRIGGGALALLTAYLTVRQAIAPP